jgi:hypothetical protein
VDAGLLAVAGRAVVAEPPPGPFEPDPPEPESDAPLALATVVDGPFDAVLPDEVLLLPAGAGEVWVAGADTTLWTLVALTVAELRVGTVVALVVAALAGVVTGVVEVVAASAEAEMSQTDCPDDGPRFGNSVWRTA